MRWRRAGIEYGLTVSELRQAVSEHTACVIADGVWSLDCSTARISLPLWRNAASSTTQSTGGDTRTAVLRCRRGTSPRNG